MSVLVSDSKKKGTFWALLPVGLLLGMFVGWGVMLSLALDDPSFGVEPDYYEKALHFDAYEAQRRESRRLGWALDFEVEEASGKDAELSVRLLDAKRQPLDNAKVQVTAFHNARSRNVKTLVLEPRGSGRYAARLSSPRPGLWEFRFRVDKGTDRFLKVIRADVAEASE